MAGILDRLIGAAMALAFFAAPVMAADPTGMRPLTAEDIVGLEAFGRGGISPDGRWAIYEKRGRYDAIPRFDYAQRSAWATVELWVVDLERPEARPELLLPGEGRGILRVAWSPTGKRLLVHKFRDGRLEAGVVDIGRRSVAWTGLTPEIPVDGASSEWIDDDRLIVMTRPAGSLPQVMRYYSGSQERLPEAWRRTSLGQEASRTVVETEGGVVRSEVPEPERALVLIDLAAREHRLLTQGGIVDFSLSPDRRSLAVVADGEPMSISAGELLQADADRRRRLSIVGLEDGSLTRALDYDVAPHLLRWSPESRSVLVWVRRDGATWSEGGLAQVSAAEVKMSDLGGLTPGTPAEILRGVRADWMGRAPVVYARERDGTRFDWHVVVPGEEPRAITAHLASSPPSLAAVDGDGLRFFADGSLWASDARSTRRLTPEGPAVRAAVVGDPEEVFRLKINNPPRQDWVAAIGGRGESLVISEAGRVSQLGPDGDGDPRTLAVSPEASLVLTREGLVETLHLRTAGRDDRLDRVNASLSNVSFPKPTPIDHLDALGRPTRSWLFLPTDRGVGEALGLIVQVYPGATESGYWSGPLTLTYGIRAEVLAGAGFAVLSPSIPADPSAPQNGDLYLQSVDLSVDAALAAFPTLPSDRMAVIGHSFGGLAALQIASRTDRYRAFVASSAPTDAFGFWGEFDTATRIQPEDGVRMRNQQGWAEVGQGRLGGSPWEVPQAYIAFSPYFVAERITAPTLLITADLDYVPMSQAERVFSVLYREGRKARIVTYWGEHHQLWSPANIRDRYLQITEWLSLTLAAPASGNSQDPGELPMP